MRRRTAVLVFGAAAATGAAVIGAATATLLGTCSADRVERAYTAMAGHFFTMPPLDEEPPGLPHLHLVEAGGDPR